MQLVMSCPATETTTTTITTITTTTATTTILLLLLRLQLLLLLLLLLRRLLLLLWSHLSLIAVTVTSCHMTLPFTPPASVDITIAVLHHTIAIPQAIAPCACGSSSSNGDGGWWW